MNKYGIEWNPIRIENGKIVGYIPDIDDNKGDEFLITYETLNGRRFVYTETWNDNHNWFETFEIMSDDLGYGIVAWANMPEPYEGE